MRVIETNAEDTGRHHNLVLTLDPVVHCRSVGLGHRGKGWDTQSHGNSVSVLTSTAEDHHAINRLVTCDVELRVGNESVKRSTLVGELAYFIPQFGSDRRCAYNSPGHASESLKLGKEARRHSPSETDYGDSDGFEEREMVEAGPISTISKYFVDLVKDDDVESFLGM